MTIMRAYSLCAVFCSLLPLLNAQLNPNNAPNTTWSPYSLSDYEQIVSVINLDAVATDTKRWDLVPSVYTQDAVASYSPTGNDSYGIDAIRQDLIAGTDGFITQHVISNFLIDIADDCTTANATYYGYVTLFTNPQQSSGQYVNLAGYYNTKMVKTDQGWRIGYLEYRFFGPGWTGNLSILPPGSPSAPPDTYEPPMLL